MILLFGLSIQALAVGFYFFGTTALLLIDTLALRLHYIHTFPWLLSLGMLAHTAGSAHLSGRLIKLGPEKLKKRLADILASLSCIALPGWATLSYLIENSGTLHDYLFYGVPTAFNMIVLSLAIIPPLHRRFFEDNTILSKSR